MSETLCPICYYGVSAPYFDGGEHPLATLGWPASLAEAQHMARYPLDFVQCLNCTHVWNRSFTYAAVPYQKNPNRMFNKGGIWQQHLVATQMLLRKHLPQSPTIVDIGCGEGHFVRGLADMADGMGRYIGLDPNGAAHSGRGVHFISRYFDPATDVAHFEPDAIVMRHVLEHLTDSARFVDQLAWHAAGLAKPVVFFAEMPCIDRVQQTGRLADFFYEHPSHFTTRSFRQLMQRAGTILELAHGYNGEVVFALVRFEIGDNCKGVAGLASTFFARAKESRDTIQRQLTDLASEGKRVAIWGGTGKAAAFIHQFGADAKRFPLVVDSDAEKVGTFVPGAGQEIVSRDVLKAHPADVVVIPAQWRARDVVLEMDREGIAAAQILIEHDGRLIDFARDDHPYR